jgi:hypothetical protein
MLTRIYGLRTEAMQEIRIAQGWQQWRWWWKQ